MGIKAFNHGDDFVNKLVRAVAGDSTGLDAASPFVAPTSGLTATGGVISDYNTPPGAVYRAHVFTASGTFDITDDTSDFGQTVEYLVVAGGGSGGSGYPSWGSGGGGAGGFRTNVSGHPLAGSAFPVSDSPGSYTVTVGSGGAGSGTAQGAGRFTSPGTPSVFGSITSTGGGGGGGQGEPSANDAGEPGGSGGGGQGGNGADNGGAGNTPPSSPPQGFSGGGGADGVSAYTAGGGGGGAGGAGGTAHDPPASDPEQVVLVVLVHQSP